LNKIDDLLTSLDNMDKRSESQIRRIEWVIRIIIIALTSIIFLSGGELILVLLGILILSRISKLLFKGEMPFAVRWFKMLLETIKILIISLLIINVLEYLIPEIGNILYYSVKMN